MSVWSSVEGDILHGDFGGVEAFGGKALVHIESECTATRRWRLSHSKSTRRDRRNFGEDAEDPR